VSGENREGLYPRWAKGGKEREVPLGDVSLEILRQVRPASPSPRDPVWLNSEGGRLAGGLSGSRCENGEENGSQIGCLEEESCKFLILLVGPGGLEPPT
jgi:hypothetical protein